MIKKKIIPVFIGLLIAAALTAGCGPIEVPYLVLEAHDFYRYDPGSSEGYPNVYVDYYYQAENRDHYADITVEKLSVPENTELISERRRLHGQDGEIDFYLKDGSYTLRVTILSRRGGRYYRLPFLDETVEFSVELETGGGL